MSAPDTNAPAQAAALKLLARRQAHVLDSVGPDVHDGSPLRAHLGEVLDLTRTIALVRIADALERIDEGLAMHVEQSLADITRALETQTIEAARRDCSACANCGFVTTRDP